MFKGIRGLKHFIVTLKHIITPIKLLARPGVVSVTIYIHMLYLCMLTLKYVHIYMLYLCFIPASSLLIHLYSYFTCTFLAVCVCVPAYWASECVEQRERLTKLLGRPGVVSVTPCFTCSQCFTPALLLGYSSFTPALL